MTIAPMEIETAAHNPLDILEELVSANEWPFDRSSSDEMVVEATGRWCDYRMFFVWREDVHALHFDLIYYLSARKQARSMVTTDLKNSTDCATTQQARKSGRHCVQS